MKKDIHPEYGRTTVQCACGHTFETGSTVKGTIQVEVCSACHPFFTGKQKIMDTAGRIDRFTKKFGDKVVHAVKTSKAAPVTQAQTVVSKSAKAGSKPMSIKEKLQIAKEKAAAVKTPPSPK